MALFLNPPAAGPAGPWPGLPEAVPKGAFDANKILKINKNSGL
jgi:hypothetical protein